MMRALLPTEQIPERDTPIAIHPKWYDADLWRRVARMLAYDEQMTEQRRLERNAEKVAKRAMRDAATTARRDQEEAR
jgi:hypothetical protein